MGRPRTTGIGKKPRQYTRIAVDYTHKRLLLEFVAAGHTVNEAIDHFYPSCTQQDKTRKQKQISKWKKQETHIRSVCSIGKGHQQNLRSRGQATVLSTDAENDIVLWVSSMRKEGCLVSSQLLQYKALEVAADEGLTSDVFKASHSWRRRFMRRHKLSIRARTRQGQTTPEDAAAAKAKFVGEVRAAIIEHGITTVHNADQTAVFFEYLPRKTVNTRGEKTIWVKCGEKDKERATAMLLGDWHGNKYGPFIIFKSGTSRNDHVQATNDTARHGFGVRLWKEVFALQVLHGCRINGNATAWWNSHISLEFLRYHFGYRDNMEEKLLLLWDDFSGHWTQEVIDYAKSINVVLMKVPPRYTYVCQPADVAWNQPFKSRLRSRWVDCLRSQIAAHHARERNQTSERLRLADQVLSIGRVEMQEVVREQISSIQDQVGSAAFVMVAPKRTDITSWIAESWKELSSNIITSGFEKAGFLGDARSSETEEESDSMETIIDLLDQLRDLGAAGKAVTTDDEYESSSDEEL